MVTAPHIEVYEIFENKPSVKVGRLLSPDQFIAMAAAMSYVEDQFSWLDDEDVAEFVKLYREHGKQLSAEALNVFAQYLKASADCGAWADRPDWKADPKDFSRGVFAFLYMIFCLTPTLDRNCGTFGLFGCQLFDHLIEQEIETWDKPLTWPLRVARALRIPLYPLLLLFKLSTPAHCLKGDKTVMIAGREALARVTKLCRMASEEGRVFAFDPPEDQIETQVDLGGLKISTRKDGGVTFGG